MKYALAISLLLSLSATAQTVTVDYDSSPQYYCWHGEKKTAKDALLVAIPISGMTFRALPAVGKNLPSIFTSKQSGRDVLYGELKGVTMEAGGIPIRCMATRED